MTMTTEETGAAMTSGSLIESQLRQRGQGSSRSARRTSPSRSSSARSTPRRSRPPATTVQTDLSLGSEQVALDALKAGEISGYPEYTTTALTSFYGAAPEAVPTDVGEAATQARAEFEKDGLVMFEPAPFESENAVGLLATKADELGVETISDLEGQSQDLVLFGSPECRQRVDCLVGLRGRLRPPVQAVHPR